MLCDKRAAAFLQQKSKQDHSGVTDGDAAVDHCEMKHVPS